MKEVKEEEQWDRKKVFIFVVFTFLLASIGYSFKTLFLDVNTKSDSNSVAQSVRGASIDENPSSSFTSQDVKKNLEDKINSLKEEASNINLVEIASSSPQVQKVINDLKALESLPKNQAKEVCEKICGRL